MGKGIRRRDLLVHGSSFLTAAAISGPVLSKSANAQVASISADEAQKIASDAYIFAFPLNYYYRTIYSQVIDTNNKKSLGGFGKWRHDSLATPADKETTMPNNDRPYSWAWVDVRSEPWVLVHLRGRGPILQQRLGRPLGTHHRLSGINQRRPERWRLSAGTDIVEGPTAAGN